MLTTTWTTPCGIPGFHLQDSEIFFKEQTAGIKHIRHGVKAMVYTVFQFLQHLHCALYLSAAIAGSIPVVPNSIFPISTKNTESNF